MMWVTDMNGQEPARCGTPRERLPVGTPSYASVLEAAHDGTFWVSVQLPTGRLSRGPYDDGEEARAAALALDRVACRRWDAERLRAAANAERGDGHEP